MIHTLEIMSVIFLLVGLGLGALDNVYYEGERSLARQVSWLIMGVSSLVNSFLVIIEGHIIAGILILLIATICLFMYNIWRKKYNELTEEDRLTKIDNFIQKINKYKINKERKKRKTRQ